MIVLKKLTLIYLFVISINLYAQIPDEHSIKLSHSLQIINNFYVDSVNSDKLVGSAIRGMLKELDPHSIYIPSEEVKKMNEPIMGSFEGVGIQFNIFKDTLMVVHTIPGGPSEKVGLKAGDKIIEIEGDNVAGVGLTSSEVVKYLRGKKGTIVNIKVKRKRVSKILAFKITRDKIPLFSIDATYVIDNEIGYIKINRFSQTTALEFVIALDSLQKQNITKLILDLRGNGGGLMRAAISVAQEFLENGQLIVYTEGLTSKRQEFVSHNNSNTSQRQLVILIDEQSASASEIVSGAVQDWDRGVLVGRRSFGKGLVQQQFRLHDGAEMRLTISRYYTPTGRLIQKPYDNGISEYQKELSKRVEQGELYSQDSIQFPDSLKYYTLTKNRVVYGGGGIMPDVFVPWDTTYYSDYYRDLIAKGIVIDFVYDYVDKNRNQLLTTYTDFARFKEKFEITDEIIDVIKENAEKEDIEYNEEEFIASLPHLKLQIKANIANSIWNRSNFFEIYNTQSKEYNKAIEILKNLELYQSYMTGSHK